MVGLCGLALAGCGDDPSVVVTAGPSGTEGTRSTTTTEATGTTEAPAPTVTGEPSGDAEGGRTCTVPATATGPIFDPELQAEFGDLQPGPTEFDWNGDGRPDELRFDPSQDTVTIDHGGGSFRATGVPSDFGDVLYDTPGATVETAGPEGPPSAKAFREGRAGPTPAAVGDFTGDGQPDLAVFSQGVLVVHAASPQDVVGATTRDVAAPAISSTSWASPRTTTDLPFDEATVVAIGDIDGDGIGDLRVDSYAPRAFVSAAFYLGRPCDP